MVPAGAVPAPTAARLPTDCARATGLGKGEQQKRQVRPSVHLSAEIQESSLQVPHCTFFSASFGCPAFRVLGFGALQGACERWCLRSNRSARHVLRLPEWVNHPHLAARNQLRASERLARARLCFKLSGSRPGMGFAAIS